MEILLILFVGFIAWHFIKGMIKGGIKGHMMKSVDYAESIGVPRNFALKMTSQTHIIKGTINSLSNEEPKFKILDVYKQNGLAINRLYKQLQNKDAD